MSSKTAMCHHPSRLGLGIQLYTALAMPMPPAPASPVQQASIGGRPPRAGHMRADEGHPQEMRLADVHLGAHLGTRGSPLMVRACPAPPSGSCMPPSPSGTAATCASSGWMVSRSHWVRNGGSITSPGARRKLSSAAGASSAASMLVVRSVSGLPRGTESSNAWPGSRKLSDTQSMIRETGEDTANVACSIVPSMNLTRIEAFLYRRRRFAASASRCARV
mmetsp:Transcript_7151/g.22092  ORF Transcript_7151/g.22092 Transcript_7151/m.22092 type:complete len:220 (-) Transcript_7151:1279-1938(-)